MKKRITYAQALEKVRKLESRTLSRRRSRRETQGAASSHPRKEARIGRPDTTEQEGGAKAYSRRRAGGGTGGAVDASGGICKLNLGAFRAHFLANFGFEVFTGFGAWAWVTRVS